MKTAERLGEKIERGFSTRRYVLRSLRLKQKRQPFFLPAAPDAGMCWALYCYLYCLHCVLLS